MGAEEGQDSGLSVSRVEGGTRAKSQEEDFRDRSRPRQDVALFPEIREPLMGSDEKHDTSALV